MSRQEKIEEVLQILEANKGKATFGFLFSRMFAKYSLTKQTFRDYLDALATAGKIDYSSFHMIGNEDSIPITLKEKD